MNWNRSIPLHLVYLVLGVLALALAGSVYAQTSASSTAPPDTSLPAAPPATAPPEIPLDHQLDLANLSAAIAQAQLTLAQLQSQEKAAIQVLFKDCGISTNVLSNGEMQPALTGNKWQLNRDSKSGRFVCMAAPVTSATPGTGPGTGPGPGPGPGPVPTSGSGPVPGSAPTPVPASSTHK